MNITLSIGAAVLDALDLHVLHQVSFWDALILQAARQSGCVQLLTEDLQTGAVIGVCASSIRLKPCRSGVDRRAAKGCSGLHTQRLGYGAIRIPIPHD